MGAYENAVCEEGSRAELVEHFLRARAQLAERDATIARQSAALAKAKEAMTPFRCTCRFFCQKRGKTEVKILDCEHGRIRPVIVSINKVLDQKEPI